MLSFLLNSISSAIGLILWVVQKLFRPMSVLTILCAICQPKETKQKLHLFYTTFLFLSSCKDKKWSKPKNDPGNYYDATITSKSTDSSTNTTSSNSTSKTIIFIRHGESTWNDTFNKGDRPKMTFLQNFIPNLIYALYMEWYMFVTGKDNESWFYDSPLSPKGVRQAKDLRFFLQQPGTTKSEIEIMNLISGKTKGNNGQPKSQLVSSNLRRAITTMALGLQDRLDQQYPDDSIIIMPELQEISRNPDALSITPPHGKVLPSFVDKNITTCDLPRIYDKQVDTKTFHYGNKALTSNGLERMQSFCKIVFDKIDKDVVIAAGHSLWFRSFFQTYLPWNVEHKAKKKKLINGGCVSFTLHKVMSNNDNDDKSSNQQEDMYFIDPKSIHIIYGGF